LVYIACVEEGTLGVTTPARGQLLKFGPCCALRAAGVQLVQERMLAGVAKAIAASYIPCSSRASAEGRSADANCPLSDNLATSGRPSLAVWRRVGKHSRRPPQSFTDCQGAGASPKIDRQGAGQRPTATQRAYGQLSRAPSWIKRPIQSALRGNTRATSLDESLPRLSPPDGTVMTACGVCGGHASNVSKFCPACGSPAQEPVERSALQRVGGVSLRKAGGVSLRKRSSDELSVPLATSQPSPDSVGLPQVSLGKRPEPEPSVHTQLTEMAMRSLTASPAAVARGSLDVDRAAATPHKDFAGRHRAVLIGALTGVLLLVGGGLAAAILMKGSGQTESRPKTPAFQTPASTRASSVETSAPARNPTVTGAVVTGAVVTGATVTIRESTAIPTWSGPNDDTSGDGSAVFHKLGSLAPGSIVSIICTVYGRPSTVYPRSQSRLWDYTSNGYVPDGALHTGSSNPVAPTCIGTLAHTQAGSGPPSQEAGPYPLYNNGIQVNVFDSPSTSANLQLQLEDGTYVHLVCSSPGSPVLGPTDMYGTSVGTSTNWNKIDAPVTGWVSDAFVDSASATSVAPKC
jgi:hypothetical protein